jgi:hypothetical protein
MPSSLANGYKIIRKVRALFLTYGMDAPIPGKYGIYHGNINKIEFSNGWTNFCHMNQLEVCSLVVVRVEMREECIGFFVVKIH